MTQASWENAKKWDLRFLSLAKNVAQWSKDPSTKVGAVIVKNRKILSVGYNGFPKNYPDTPELYADREKKYARVVHAEMNAILNAPISIAQPCTLYVWPLFSCAGCAKHVAQTGIGRIVSPWPNEERFASEYALAKEIYKKCDIDVNHYDLKDIV